MSVSSTTTRLSAAQQSLVNHGVGLLALAPGDNLYYVLGYSPRLDERPCLLLIGQTSATYLVPELNAEQAEVHTRLPIVTWSDSTGPATSLLAALAMATGSPPTRIAVDETMPASFLLLLQRTLPTAEYITSAKVMAPIRQIKSMEETALLRKSARLADAAMEAVIEECAVGKTEIDLARAATVCFEAGEAESVTFAIVASGPNSVFPHHESGRRAIEEGDSIVIDIGARLNGYQSDITRTLFVGTHYEEWLSVYGIVLAANEAGKAAIRPGVTAADIDSAVRMVIEEAGYGANFIHRTGHGIGISVHEPPWISSENETILEEGMIFSIEPGIYIPGKFGIRIEDIVVVTGSGSETLTQSRHEPVIVRPEGLEI